MVIYEFIYKSIKSFAQTTELILIKFLRNNSNGIPSSIIQLQIQTVFLPKILIAYFKATKFANFAS